MRIVIAGLSAAYPVGGLFWDYLQYAQGLADLGHEVLYLEETGSWFYDPAAQTMQESGAAAAEWLGRQIAEQLPTLRNAWFVRDAAGMSYGSSEQSVRQFCQDAELFLNISGRCLRTLDDFPRATSVIIDTDPMYSQRYVPGELAGTLDDKERLQLERMRSHQRAFSYGENIGQPDCVVPNELFEWLPTRQPVLTATVARYRVSERDRTRQLTTVGSWDSYTKPLEVAGQIYQGKRSEFVRFQTLPRTSPLPFVLALSGDDPPREMTEHGWTYIDSDPISASAGSYLKFLASSYAEWSVAKHAYVASRSGWFSGRTAVYLALGVPSIVQDTGFSRFLPTGEGLFAFSTPDEALAAIEEVAANYERQCAAALEIAHEHFDAKRVLSKLIDDAFSDSIAPASPITPGRRS